MSQLKKLLAYFKDGNRRHRSFSNDPSKGLEYNGINANHRVSKRLYSFDIARTSRVVKELGEWVNVHEEAELANQDRQLVDYKRGRVRGRER